MVRPFLLRVFFRKYPEVTLCAVFESEGSPTTDSKMSSHSISTRVSGGGYFSLGNAEFSKEQHLVVDPSVVNAL